MDMDGLVCHGCGSSNVVFDPKRRILVCNQCGKEEFYSRATLNANGKVIFGQRNAIRFFTDGKLEDARHYAADVLNISMDNAPAMYILAYYDEFSQGKTGELHTFFSKTKRISLEYDEVQDLLTLFRASAYNLGDYEEDVIELVATNMQAQEDADTLRSFVDTLCPYLISKRPSSSFLTRELAEMYRELAEHCGIPKTCFALIKSIETNPDSPYVDNSFYLKAKAHYFYDHYVGIIGGILSAFNDPALRGKFLAAYHNKCTKYRQDAGIE